MAVRISMGETIVEGDTLKEATRQAKKEEKRQVAIEAKRKQKHERAELAAWASYGRIAHTLDCQALYFYDASNGRHRSEQEGGEAVFIDQRGKGETAKGTWTLSLQHHVSAFICDGGGWDIGVRLVYTYTTGEQEVSWVAVGAYDGEVYGLTMSKRIGEQIETEWQKECEQKAEQAA